MYHDFFELLKKFKIQVFVLVYIMQRPLPTISRYTSCSYNIMFSMFTIINQIISFGFPKKNPKRH